MEIARIAPTAPVVSSRRQPPRITIRVVAPMPLPPVEAAEPTTAAPTVLALAAPLPPMRRLLAAYEVKPELSRLIAVG
jgi:hypothetical protein